MDYNVIRKNIKHEIIANWGWSVETIGINFCSAGDLKIIACNFLIGGDLNYRHTNWDCGKNKWGNILNTFLYSHPIPLLVADDPAYVPFNKKTSPPNQFFFFNFKEADWARYQSSLNIDINRQGISKLNTRSTDVINNLITNFEHFPFRAVNRRVPKIPYKQIVNVSFAQELKMLIPQRNAFRRNWQWHRDNS